MRIAKEDVPVRIDLPGAKARQQAGFGDASGAGTMGAEYFSLAAGADMAPLLKGLEGDLCQAPHWGYLLEGQVVVTYDDGGNEQVREGDLFYWPPGHTVRVEKDAEMILFSPQEEHGRVMDHIRSMAGG